MAEDNCRSASSLRAAPLLALLGIALLSSGCAFRRQAAGMAIEHNDFVAQTTNRQTVLNILRAREREPMHFTSFASVGGKVQGTGQLGLNSAFNGNGGTLTQTDTTVTSTGSTGSLTSTAVTDTVADALSRGATNWTPSAQVSVTTGTDFTIGINATQEFYRGILGPLSSGIIIHYLRQGFPPDLLSHLVIGRLQFYARITLPDGTQEMVLLRTINNAPDDAESANAFAEALKCRQLDYRVSRVAESSLPVPVSNLSGLNADVLGRLRAVTAPNGTNSYWLDSPARNEFALSLSNPERRQCAPTEGELRREVSEWAARSGLRPRRRPASRSGAPALPPEVSARPEQLRVEATTTGPVATGPSVSQGIAGAGFTFTSEIEFDDLLPDRYRGELVVDMTIRSVEGILYYLGEYIRDEATSPMLQHNSCPGRGYCIPIIRVRPASEIRATARFIDVSYRGRTYAVPIAGAHLNQDSGRSSQAISLVQQLLNLHRSASDLPSTPLVRIVN